MEMDRNLALYGEHLSDLDIATRVACELTEWVQPSQDELSPLALAWIAEHERLDKVRAGEARALKTKNELKQSAWDKLTPEERRALGL